MHPSVARRSRITPAEQFATGLRTLEPFVQNPLLLVETRDKLLDAAVDVFIEKGFTRSSVDEICRRAGTTKGAFFHHFENKQEVGLLALDRFADKVVVSLRDAPRERDPLRRIVDSLESQPFPTCLLAVLTLELGSDDQTFRNAANTAYERVLVSVEGLINEALHSGVNGDGVNGKNPRALAELFMATMEGSLILARAKEDRAIIENNITAFESYLRSSLT